MQVSHPPTYDRVVGINAVISRPKIIEVTNWNMLTTASKSVAHGLTLANISGVEVLIDNDAGDARSKLDSDCTFCGCADGALYLTATDVEMSRHAGGCFADAAYSGVGHRGWIKLWNKE